VGSASTCCHSGCKRRRDLHERKCHDLASASLPKMNKFDPLRTHDSFAFAGHPMFIGSADRFTIASSTSVCGIFPFCFREQPVGLASLFGKPTAAPILP
jgi:hypothetical protein